MRARAFGMGAVFALVFVSASARAQNCTNAAMYREYFGAAAAAQAPVCPPPSAAVHLSAAAERALDPAARPPAGAADEQAIIAALHELAERARSEALWGAEFATKLEAFLRAFNPARCDERLSLQFTELHPTNDADADCACAFETSSEGNPGYACFHFREAAAPAPECKITGLQTYELADAGAAARAYRLIALASAATKRLQTGCTKIAVDTLKRAETHWHTLLGEGYVQYPWELWFSRLLSNDYRNYTRCFASDPNCTGLEGLEPEALRPIFLHPGVGLGFPGFGKHDGKPSARADAVVLLELAGFVDYPSDFKNYFGVSAILGFEKADFARPRLGLMIHLSHYLQLGYLFGLLKETRLNGTLYLSIDLIGLTNRSLGLTPPAP